MPKFTRAVITIGTFDGVHKGHQQIIKQLKEEAKAIGGEAVIISFHPHPRKIVSTKEIHILNTLAEKTELLEGTGVDHLVVVPFDEQFANQSPEDYVKDFLFDKFRPHTVIIGYDHRFGKNRKGDYHLLEAYGKELGFKVKEIPEYVLHEVTVSSTKIRQALLASDIATANEYLGYDYFFSGQVVHGNKLGKSIGYPTANIEVQDEAKLIPGNGVYAVVVSLWNNTYKGMMNIGMRPTVDGKKRTIEVNIIDFDKNIYDQPIRVYVKFYLRGEMKFNGLDELKDQLARDKEHALQLL